MRYMGSKRRIAPLILPIILRNRTDTQPYIEPFCGGCNMIDKVKGKRIAMDSNKYLIALFKGLLNGCQVPKCSREQHLLARQDMKNGTNEHYTDFEIGAIGFLYCYRAVFFGGYNGDHPDRYDLQMINNIMHQIPNLKGVEFHCCNYNEFHYPPNSLIYCDPPYENTSEYKDKFDSPAFWQWAREMSKSIRFLFQNITLPQILLAFGKWK